MEKIGRHPGRSKLPEVLRRRASDKSRLGKLAHDQPLALGMLSALPPETARTDEDIDALLANLRDIVDIEQNNLNLGVRSLKARNDLHHHPSRYPQGHTNLDLTSWPISAGSELPCSFFKAIEKLNTIPIEACRL